MNGLANSGIDPSLAMQEATQNDLVRRKLDMDALRARLGDGATKQEKLRESCEGFEAIFLQKMWEQMRKTVPKEGYLHSKDEEMYQSLFDIELCKKMASAGGIGLADMLYEQLSQQLENSGRTTSPSSYRTPLSIAPTTSLLPFKPEAQGAAPQPDDKKLTAEELYSPLPGDKAGADSDEDKAGGEDLILGALHEIKADLGMVPKDAPGEAVREWARARDTAVGAATAAVAAATMTVEAAGADKAAGIGKKSESDPALASWQGPGPVSAKPRPISPFGKNRKTDAVQKTDTDKSAAPAHRGMAPQDTLWPLAENRGVVGARFGWEDDPASGRRRWNSGVRIDAEPGTAVRAILAGTVVYAGPREGYGNTVVLEHKEGYRSYYSNLMPSDLKVGDPVKHGAEFAQIAAQASPSAKGENSASLHFELKKGEMALNPELAIPRMTTASR